MKISTLFKTIISTVFLLLAFSSAYSQTGWLQINSFGTNPGNLLMYRYVPTNITTSAPLVVVLHGCTQNASNYSNYSGWDTLANHNKFYVIHVEQQSQNNSSLCFNWFLPTNYTRGQGEVLSVKQMVDYMKSQYSIDNSRVFVTGLSAGACLTSNMLGAYPDVFAAGAIMAGTPYKSASDYNAASNAMNGLVTKSAAQWGDLVRAENPSYIGAFPKVAIFQGTNDAVVNSANQTELMKQWTNVHNTDQVADTEISSFNGNTNIAMKGYNDNSGNKVVQTFSINTMPHGISIDPGNCFQQGGISITNSYSYDYNFYSSFWAAEFFGIINKPYTINGPINVAFGQTNRTYSVTNQTGSSFQWSFPTGVSVVSGQGTNQIIVNWGNESGFVTVNETKSTSCIVGPIVLFVNASANIGIENNNETTDDITIIPNLTDNSLNITSKLNSYSIYIYDQTGRLLQSSLKQSNNTSIQLPTDLNQGIYMVRIISDKRNVCCKFIKIL